MKNWKIEKKVFYSRKKIQNNIQHSSLACWRTSTLCRCSRTSWTVCQWKLLWRVSFPVPRRRPAPSVPSLRRGPLREVVDTAELRTLSTDNDTCERTSKPENLLESLSHTVCSAMRSNMKHAVAITEIPPRAMKRFHRTASAHATTHGDDACVCNASDQTSWASVTQ